MSCEPRFNFFEDELPESDPRAYDCLYCKDCRHMVHAGNNETMMAWLDTGIGAVCLECVVKRYKSEIPQATNQWSFDDLAFTTTEDTQ